VKISVCTVAALSWKELLSFVKRVESWILSDHQDSEWILVGVGEAKDFSIWLSGYPPLLDQIKNLRFRWLRMKSEATENVAWNLAWLHAQADCVCLLPPVMDVSQSDLEHLLRPSDYMVKDCGPRKALTTKKKFLAQVGGLPEEVSEITPKFLTVLSDRAKGIDVEKCLFNIGRKIGQGRFSINFGPKVEYQAKHL
jgi:hypothetical protein